MKKISQGTIVIVRNKTQLEELKEQFNTFAQASFFIERQRENIQSKAGFLSGKQKKALASNRARKKEKVGSWEMDDFRREQDNYDETLEVVQNRASRFMKTKLLETQYLPSYLFTPEDIVIVIGQDGLVANTAKYARDIPIIAINPEPHRFDGVLLPFTLSNFEIALQKTVNGNYDYKEITMAEALLDDGQQLLAFNDLYIGVNSHVSAKYQITYGDITESHSSSGIIISTGAGATGWMSSVFNMVKGINEVFGGGEPIVSPAIEWDTDRLLFAVREPFLSKTSQAGITIGFIQSGEELVVESMMSQNGVIFSDGIESDYLKFNSGSIARIGLAKQRAKLVTS